MHMLRAAILALIVALAIQSAAAATVSDPAPAASTGPAMAAPDGHGPTIPGHAGGQSGEIAPDALIRAAAVTAVPIPPAMPLLAAAFALLGVLRLIQRRA